MSEQQKRFISLKSARAIWDNQFYETAMYVHPMNTGFNSSFLVDGMPVLDQVFDTVGVYANQLLAAALHGTLTNPLEQWFALQLMRERPLSKEEAVHISTVANMMFKAIINPQANFTNAIHEGYLEYGAFGTSVLFTSKHPSRNTLLFQARPLHECFIAEDEAGFVNTLYRDFKQSAGNLASQFGESNLPDKIRQKLRAHETDCMFEILHIVEPRKLASRQRKGNKGKAYTSTYRDVSTDYVIFESGFDSFPYHVPRFYKSGGETYGRGPGLIKTPDIRLLNEMQRTLLIAAQKKAEPIVFVENESVIGDINLVPNGLGFIQPGAEKPFTLDLAGDIGITLEMITRKQQEIKDAFFLSQLELPDGPQMTATEVLQRREVQMRLMGPIIGRLQTELLRPMLERVYEIMLASGAFPEAPASLQGEALTPVYTSPISRAQQQSGALGISKMVQTLEFFFQMDPSILDNIDMDAMLNGVSAMFGIDPKWMRSNEEVKKLRESRNAQIKENSDIENANVMSEMTRNLSIAKGNASEKTA